LYVIDTVSFMTNTPLQTAYLAVIVTVDNIYQFLFTGFINTISQVIVHTSTMSHSPYNEHLVYSRS